MLLWYLNSEVQFSELRMCVFFLLSTDFYRFCTTLCDSVFVVPSLTLWHSLTNIRLVTIFKLIFRSKLYRYFFLKHFVLLFSCTNTWPLNAFHHKTLLLKKRFFGIYRLRVKCLNIKVKSLERALWVIWFCDLLCRDLWQADIKSIRFFLVHFDITIGHFELKNEFSGKPWNVHSIDMNQVRYTFSNHWNA